MGFDDRSAVAKPTPVCSVRKRLGPPTIAMATVASMRVAVAQGCGLTYDSDVQLSGLVTSQLIPDPKWREAGGYDRTASLKASPIDSAQGSLIFPT